MSFDAAGAEGFVGGCTGACCLGADAPAAELTATMGLGIAKGMGGVDGRLLCSGADGGAAEADAGGAADADAGGAADADAGAAAGTGFGTNSAGRSKLRVGDCNMNCTNADTGTSTDTAVRQNDRMTE